MTPHGTPLGTMGLRRRGARLAWCLVAAVPLLALPAIVAPTGASVAAASSTSPCSATPVTSTSGLSFHATETLCRTFFDHGIVDQRQFAVSVSDTTALQDGQVVTVSWTGAHPTGAIWSAPQFSQAATQEYPVVLMECRGIDSARVPADERVTPETCWTATPGERIGNTPGGLTPMWALDSHNSKADQSDLVNVPLPLPAACLSQTAPGPNYWVPFDAAGSEAGGGGGTVYPVGPAGCAGAPPEMLTTGEDPTIVPSDTTYAATAVDGTGQAKFTIEAGQTNNSLGCSQTVPCSLVIIPIEGISCNANPQVPLPQYACESEGDFAPGSLNLGGSANPPAQAVEGSYWWSGSNWDRRISVPLGFATGANACARNTSTPLQFYGSELMTQATQQWNPHFCLNSKLFNVNSVQLSEPQAKNSLQQGDIEAAIQGEPPPVPPGKKSFFTTPTVQAPIAVTGFAIAYVIDNADGTPYTQLKLDPRLLAKLMTESYYGTNNIQSGDPGIAKNPQSIYDDPEFQALNPTFRLPSGVQPAPAATLFSILAQADTIWALTSYINADPEARAWLNGYPDPWGMTVNPAYKGVQLPVESWPLLDTSTDGPDYTEEGNPFCAPALGEGKAKEPDRPLIDNPQDTLANVAYNMQYSIAASLITCNNDPITPSYEQLGPELLGFRFLIGLVSLPAAQQLDLDTAALQAYANPELESVSQTDFVAGRLFVAPTQASLQSAAALFQPDPTTGSWVLPETDFPGDSSAQGAYPGTMLMAADIPTSGLPAQDATEYGEYLSFAATAGQTGGAGVGQLPAGYLPMTATNGMGDEVAYTQAAAVDVAAQNGAVPGFTPGAVTHPSAQKPGSAGSASAPNSGSSSLGASESQATTGNSALTASGAFGAAGTTRPGALSGQSGSASGSAGRGLGAASGGATKAYIQPAAVIGRTSGLGSGLGGLALPLALLIALVGGAWSGVMWWKGRKGVRA